MPIHFAAADEAPAEAQVLAVPVFEGCTLPPGTPAAELDLDYLVARGFEGRAEQVEALMADDGTTVLAVGMGPAGEVDLEALRRGAAAAVKKAWKSPSLALALLDAAPGIGAAAAAQAMTEGAAL
ncbi:MAG TPA: M17 family peptidase N-terminal domain-containing protein, partial [Acidimicrobiales bacterium]|nr:M17 family peptidase N-terminal domain-containing protein [Acidimicrobiales bacterium]